MDKCRSDYVWNLRDRDEISHLTTCAKPLILNNTAGEPTSGQSYQNGRNPERQSTNFRAAGEIAVPCTRNPLQRG